MYTRKDIEVRSFWFVDCSDHKTYLHVKNGELLLEKQDGEDRKIKARAPFQLLLAVFVIGDATLSVPLIDKCRQFGVAFIVLKSNLRPVAFLSNPAEANYALRIVQHSVGYNLDIAKALIANKVMNQKTLLQKTRRRDEATLSAMAFCSEAIDKIPFAADADSLRGIEGSAAKMFFGAYFQDFDWTGRFPRAKCDALNVALDIGYSILFNFIEAFLRMYGFDLYIGVNHTLFFQRKSLVCDMMEPFRCIVDHTMRNAFKLKKFSMDDFEKSQDSYRLKWSRCSVYYQEFVSAIVVRKGDIFQYVQSYYRCFMGRKSMPQYPNFLI